MQQVTFGELKKLLLDNEKRKFLTKTQDDELSVTVYNLSKVVEGEKTEVGHLLSARQHRNFRYGWMAREMQRAPQITKIDAEQAFEHRYEN